MKELGHSTASFHRVLAGSPGANIAIIRVSYEGNQLETVGREHLHKRRTDYSEVKRMAEKQKEKTKKAKPVETKTLKKYIAWSRNTPTIVVPATMRDALGLAPKAKTEVEISLLNDRSGILVRISACSSR